jgi:hypothetical protein
MESSKMKKHVTIVGSIQIGFSTLGIIAAVVIFVALSFARAVVGDDDIPQTVLRFLSISLPILIGSLSLLGLTAGICLLLYKSWARYVVIVLSTIDCLNIPFGTTKGIYSIWVLIQDETVKLFNKEEFKTGIVEPVLVS